MTDVAPNNFSHPGGRDLVMIVEDDPTSRRALARLLAASGFRPQAFGSAEDALGFASTGALPRILLVDLDLPGMCGLDLIHQLSQLDPSVYPVLITGTDEANLAERLRDKPVAYLRKPLNFDVLISILSQRRMLAHPAALQ
jgi:FixJ family two-component response regulator